MRRATRDARAGELHGVHVRQPRVHELCAHEARAASANWPRGAARSETGCCAQISSARSRGCASTARERRAHEQVDVLVARSSSTAVWIVEDAHLAKLGEGLELLLLVPCLQALFDALCAHLHADIGGKILMVAAAAADAAAGCAGWLRGGVYTPPEEATLLVPATAPVGDRRSCSRHPHRHFVPHCGTLSTSLSMSGDGLQAERTHKALFVFHTARGFEPQEKIGRRGETMQNR